MGIPPIDITESEATRLIASYQRDKTDCRERAERGRALIEDAENEEAEIDRRIEFWSAFLSRQANENAASGYETNWPLFKKAEYILRKANTVLTTRGIAEAMLLEENYTANDIPTLVSNIGATLKQKVDREQIFSRQEMGSDIYYGLRTWLDIFGNAFEFKYLPKLLKRISQSPQQSTM